MQTPSGGRQQELRLLISGFLTERLNSKLEKLLPDDPKHLELREQYQWATWIGDAARRAAQIQVVTHTLKPIHPDAKGSSLFCAPAELPKLDVVGSHCLGSDFDSDVVGNAAALDVYKFLRLSLNGQSLLDLCVARDADLAAVLSDDPGEANAWMQAFAGLVAGREGLASHTLAKQLYWFISDAEDADPHRDDSFHLLAPLFASSLIHRVHMLVRDDRFSDEAKDARAARREGRPHTRPVRDYAELAVQKMGGTKPQNISQLNSERRGDNYLLASLPPIWTSPDVRPLWGVESAFKAFGWRPSVQKLAKGLRRFLVADPSKNKQTREAVDEAVESLLDELLQFAAEFYALPAGWSQHERCTLGDVERLWLDPYGFVPAQRAAGLPLPLDPAEQVAESFARWLNAQLRDPLPMGEDEFKEWRRRAQAALRDHEWVPADIEDEEVAHESA